MDTHAGKKVMEAEMHRDKACKAGSLQPHYWPSSKMPRPKLDVAKNWPYFRQLSNRIQPLPLNLIPKIQDFKEKLVNDWKEGHCRSFIAIFLASAAFV